MKTIDYKQVDETVHTETLENGLRIALIPRPGLSKVFGFFLTDFGAQDLSFVPLGETDVFHSPMGVAHFLEHKMFDKGDRDVFSDFSRLGSDANAFTNSSETAYFFTATGQIEENVALLLDFVQQPYFTDGTVEKEKGIILQEEQMYADQPDQQLFMGTLGALFQNHPVREEVLGTPESIRGITKEDLYTCYGTFYHPSNMILCLTGSFDPDEMIALIRRNQEEKEFAEPRPIERFLPEEPAAVAEKERIIRLPVSTPRCMVGLKDYGGPIGTAELQDRILLTLMSLDYLFGKGGPFHRELYRRGLIDGSFSYQRTCDKTFGFTLIAGNTDRPEEFAEAVKELLLSAGELKIPDEEISRMKKRLIGSRLRSLDSIEVIGQEYPWYENRGLDYFNQGRLIDQLTSEDIHRFLGSWVDEERISVCMVVPE